MRKQSVDVQVVEVVRRPDDNKCQVKLKTWSYTDNEDKYFHIELSELSPTRIFDDVASCGGFCENAESTFKGIMKMVKYLLKNRINIRFQHQILGWKKTQTGSCCFFANEKYCKEDTNLSYYAGEYLVEPKGNFSEIVNMFRECIVGNVPLEAIASLATAATVLPFANLNWDTSIYNPLIHLVGNSTTGKSTAALLFVSFGAAPVGKSSYFLSFLGTMNAIIKKVENNVGFPCAIDEFSTGFQKKEWSHFIYILANGYGKSRCTAGGNEADEGNQFQTVFLSNGEMSILKKCNQNEGIRARLFEFPDIVWTRSAKESDRIKETTEKNYAILTPMIAVELLQNSCYWKEKFFKWCTRVKERMEEDNVSFSLGNRVTNYVALFAMSCELIGVVMNMELDIKGVFEFFYNFIIIKNAEDASIGLRAYDVIRSFIALNKDKFADGDNAFLRQSLTSEQVGYRCIAQRRHKFPNGTYTDRYYVFEPATLDAILSQHGFVEPAIALRDLAAKKYMRCKDKNRLKFDFEINDMKVPMYGIWVEENEFTPPIDENVDAND